MSGVEAPGAGSNVWHGGYVVDVSYIEPVTTDLCPAWVSMACVLNGQPPLDTDRRLVWAELGSGSGLSACMVAAANADVDVWGCDFNPAHVERARGFATRAALGNCEFDEASFEEVAANDSLGPPEVDVVIVHGVYSWISNENQQHIIDFLRRRLRPGGIAYVMYEVPTGWASMVPIAEALRLQVEAAGLRSDLAFPAAVSSMLRLADGGARFFPLGAHEQRQLVALPTADLRYAVHEYLGEHFGPLMFDEVADAVAAARCSYIGSLDPVDHVPDFWVAPALADLVRGTEDRGLQEMFRDLAVERALRRDLFRRGLAPTTVPQRERWLHDLTIVGLDRELGEEDKVGIPVGEATLTHDFYAPLVEALKERALTVTDVRELGNASLTDAVAAVCLLVAGGYAAPMAATTVADASRDSARRLNQLLVAENRLGGDHQSLIAPTTGAAVGAEYVEMLTLDLLWQGADADPSALAKEILKVLAAQGRSVRENDEVIDSENDAMEITRARVQSALNQVSRYERLGIL